MSDADKYLSQLNELKRKQNFKTARKIYKEAELKYIDKVYDEGLAWYKHGNEKLKDLDERAALQAVANRLLDASLYPEHFILGAKLYDKLGKGKKIIHRLLKDVETASTKGNMNNKYFEQIEDFIKKVREDSSSEKQTNLESRLAVFILFTIGGIALILNSLNLTGFAISNMTQITPKLSGLLLIIAGLVGMFLVLKK